MVWWFSTWSASTPAPAALAAGHARTTAAPTGVTSTSLSGVPERGVEGKSDARETGELSARAGRAGLSEATLSSVDADVDVDSLTSLCRLLSWLARLDPEVELCEPVRPCERERASGDLDFVDGLRLNAASVRLNSDGRRDMSPWRSWRSRRDDGVPGRAVSGGAASGDDGRVAEVGAHVGGGGARRLGVKLRSGEVCNTTLRICGRVPDALVAGRGAARLSSEMDSRLLEFELEVEVEVAVVLTVSFARLDVALRGVEDRQGRVEGSIAKVLPPPKTALGCRVCGSLRFLVITPG
jgi:hypothetical protein